MGKEKRFLFPCLAHSHWAGLPMVSCSRMYRSLSKQRLSGVPIDLHSDNSRATVSRMVRLGQVSSRFSISNQLLVRQLLKSLPEAFELEFGFGHFTQKRRRSE